MIFNRYNPTSRTFVVVMRKVLDLMVSEKMLFVHTNGAMLQIFGGYKWGKFIHYSILLWFLQEILEIASYHTFWHTKINMPGNMIHQIPCYCIIHTTIYIYMDCNCWFKPTTPFTILFIAYNNNKQIIFFMVTVVNFILMAWVF